MTTPAPSGGPSPLRVGGLALLGVGAVAGIIGLTTLATGNGIDNPAAAPPTSTPSASAPAEPGFTSTDGPTPDGGVPVPSFGPTPTSEIGGPGGDGGDGTGGDGSDGDGPGSGGTGGGSGSGGSGSGGTGGGSGSGGVGGGSGSGGAEAVRMPLRVYNNSTIQGLAARGAGDFRSAGWTVTEVGGYNGLIPTSTVYYENPSEQAAAEYLAQAYGLRAEPRFDGIRSASPGVIIILTQDYQGA